MKVTYHSRSSSVYQNPCFTKAGAVSRHVRSAILKVALKQPPTPSAQCPSPSTPRCVIACEVYVSRLVPQPRVASWHTGRYSASTCKAVEGKCKSTSESVQEQLVYNVQQNILNILFIFLNFSQVGQLLLTYFHALNSKILL